MTIDGLDDAAISAILAHKHRIAVVGASANPQRPSFEVMAFLIAQGHDVTPVNPGLKGQILQGRPVTAMLDGATPLDLVDIFRASDQVGPIVDDAVRLGARIVWMQRGVIDTEAAGRARAAGLTVIMDRCPIIETRRLGLAAPA